MPSITDRCQRWITGLIVAFILLVGALVVWPEPPGRSLVPANGWQATGGFVEITPPGKELRRSSLSDPEVRYWRSWSPEHNSQPGTLASAYFQPEGAFAVPYNGFAGEPGVNAYIECAGTGQRSYLATSRTNNQWSEVVVSLPESFCQGQVRVIAESSSDKDYIALGTPYALSTLSLAKRSSLVGFWFLLIAATVIIGWFALGSMLAARRWQGFGPVAAGLITVGLLGYLQFFLFWYAPGPARVLAFLLVTVGAWMGFSAMSGHRTYLGRQFDFSPVRGALLLWLGIAVACFALITMVDSGAGPWEVNGRFTPARWSSDNQLAGFAARLLVSGDHADVSDFGQWSLGDRPPLAYGWHAALHSVFAAVSRWNDGAIYFYRYQLAIGIVLNTCWAAAIALLLPKLKLSRAHVLFAILALALFPFFIFNSAYIWPKLLSGTFALAAAWLLLGVEPERGRLKDDTPGLAAAAALSALGLLTHGGSAFGIIVMLGLAVIYRGFPSIRGALIAAGTAVAILIPWSLWQSSHDVHSNALVKFAFAGTFGFGDESRSVTDTVIQSYQQLGWSGWLEKKRDGLMTLLFGLRNTCGVNEMGIADSFVSRWRASDFYYVIPSLNVLILGLAARGLWRSGRDETRTAYRGARRLLMFGLASIAFNWLTTWDCFINHHQSYQALIAIHLALVISLMMAGRMGKLLIGTGMLYGVIVWILEPLNHFARFDWTSIGIFVLMCAWGAGTLWSQRASLKDGSA